MDYRVRRTGDMSNDELMHWKYIDKVRTKTGKWRYIYDDVKNALSDEDEGNELADKMGIRKDNPNIDRIATAKYIYQGAETTTKRQNKAYEKYMRAKTFVGKAKDLGKVWVKYQKQQARSIQRGANWLKRNFAGSVTTYTSGANLKNPSKTTVTTYGDGTRKIDRTQN